VTSGPLAPLRRPDVAMIWAAGVVSDVGTWVQLIVVGSLIARTTGSAFLTGLSAMATFTPQGIFSPIGGMLADRFDRRKLFGCALAGQALATTILAILLARHVTNAPTLAFVIFFQSSFGAFGNPSYQAMTPDLVPPEELQAMVGLSIASWNAGRIVGPLLATLLDRTVGAPAAIVANAFTFAGLSLVVALLKRPFPPSARYGGESLGHQLKTGAKAVFHSQGCWVAIQITVVLNVIIAPFIGLMPIYARKVLHGGTGLAGTLSSVQGIGALLGALSLTSLIRHYGRFTSLLIAIALVLSGYVVYANAPRAIFALCILPFMGFGSAVFFASMMSLIQRDAPPDQRGRVMSLMQSATGTSYGLAIIIFGQLSDSIGLRQSFMLATAAGAIATVIGLIRYPHWRSIVDIARAPEPDMAHWHLMPEF
jgi:MFS family permease